MSAAPRREHFSDPLRRVRLHRSGLVPNPRGLLRLRGDVVDREKCSVAAQRRGHVGEVALGIGQRPPGRRVLVRDEAAAYGDRGGDSRLGLVRRHPDVEVDPVDLRVRRVDLLEPDGRPATAWVDEVLGAVFAVLVSKHGPPERLHLGDVECIDCYKDRLHDGWVGEDAQLARFRRDLPSQLEVALAQPVVVGRDRDQPHDHVIVTQVDVRVVVIEAGHLADCVHEPGAGCERPGAEVRARSFAHHTPVLDAVGLVEPPGCHPFGHALTVTPLDARTSAWYKTMYGTEAFRPAEGSTGGAEAMSCEDLWTKTRVTLRRCHGGTG